MYSKADFFANGDKLHKIYRTANNDDYKQKRRPYL